MSCIVLDVLTCQIRIELAHGQVKFLSRLEYQTVVLADYLEGDGQVFSLLKGNRERPYDTLYRCEISGYSTKKDNITENSKCYQRENIATNIHNE